MQPNALPAPPESLVVYLNLEVLASTSYSESTIIERGEDTHDSLRERSGNLYITASLSPAVSVQT